MVMRLRRGKPSIRGGRANACFRGCIRRRAGRWRPLSTSGPAEFEPVPDDPRQNPLRISIRRACSAIARGTAMPHWSNVPIATASRGGQNSGGIAAGAGCFPASVFFGHSGRSAVWRSRRRGEHGKPVDNSYLRCIRVSGFRLNTHPQPSRAAGYRRRCFSRSDPLRHQAEACRHPHGPLPLPCGSIAFVGLGVRVCAAQGLAGFAQGVGDQDELAGEGPTTAPSRS